MLLTMNKVSKDYGAGAILTDVSFELDRGQSLAVVAPSGAGKSTLLSIAGLLLSPSSGSVVFDDRNVADLSDSARSSIRSEKVGFLFQHTQLIGTLRASENAAIPADFVHSSESKMSNEAVLRRTEELLISLGLKDRMQYFPHQLSVGQKRRVATARALFLRPPLIIADEPTNDLDNENAQVVVEALFERVQSGEAALLYATHDHDLAARADQVLSLV